MAKRKFPRMCGLAPLWHPAFMNGTPPSGANAAQNVGTGTEVARCFVPSMSREKQKQVFLLAINNNKLLGFFSELTNPFVRAKGRRSARSALTRRSAREHSSLAHGRNARPNARVASRHAPLCASTTTESRCRNGAMRRRNRWRNRNATQSLVLVRTWPICCVLIHCFPHRLFHLGIRLLPRQCDSRHWPIPPGLLKLFCVRIWLLFGQCDVQSRCTGPRMP